MFTKKIYFHLIALIQEFAACFTSSVPLSAAFLRINIKLFEPLIFNLVAGEFSADHCNVLIISERTVAYIMQSRESMDIDTDDDFNYVQYLMEQRNKT